ncbi:hypothetical protein Tco_0867399, partial [Tanacetum coccineum]
VVNEDEIDGELLEDRSWDDYDDSIDEVDPNIILKEIVRDVNKSFAEDTEDNANDEDNDEAKKKSVGANENISSSVKRRGRPRKTNDEAKKQTIGSKRKAT